MAKEDFKFITPKLYLFHLMNLMNKISLNFINQLKEDLKSTMELSYDQFKDKVNYTKVI